MEPDRDLQGVPLGDFLKHVAPLGLKHWHI
jgi:hypothetical protein